VNRLLGFILGMGALMLALFAVLFLGGLASAWWEIRAEKRAGLVPTRPADELREKHRALGGWRNRLSIAWAGARARAQGWRLCWCGRGAVTEFTATDNGYGQAGFGCAAWEAGDPVAINRHDAAGGYARTPVAEVAS
jgi:hypothetical protein